MSQHFSLTVKVFYFVLLLKDIIFGPTLDAVEMERAVARTAAPDRVRFLDAGNANEARRRTRAASKAVKQDLLRPDADGEVIAFVDVRLKDLLKDTAALVIVPEEIK